MKIFLLLVAGLKPIRSIVFVLLVSMWSASAIGAETNPWIFLPTQALEIKGGRVTFQSALIVDTRRPLNNPMFQDYPTKYILPVTNESRKPIWVEAEWRVPGEDPYISFGKLKPAQFGEFYWKVEDIAWNIPIPVRAMIFGDENKSDLLGSRDIVLQFPEGEGKELFLQKAKEVNSVVSKMGDAHGSEVEMPLLAGFELAEPLQPAEGAEEIVEEESSE